MSVNYWLIAGAGGSPPSPPTPEPPLIVDPSDDTSVQRVEILDLLCEGEIEGFPDAIDEDPGTAQYRAIAKNIYLNKTPVLREDADVSGARPDDKYNFTGVEYDVRYGTTGQGTIGGLEAIKREIAVNQTLNEGQAVTRRVSDATVNGVGLLFTFPRLERYDGEGNIFGVEVAWRVELSYNGGSFNTVAERSISGRFPNPVQREQFVEFDGAFPVDVRVTRISEDSDDSNTFDDIVWTSYNEVIWGKYRYPNSALVATRFDSRSFSSVPSRSYRIRGLKIRIPSNGTVNKADGSISYSGIWDGTLTARQWSSDPAWVLWDLLTTKRYGLGDHLTEQMMDGFKWEFYAASQYCSGRVSNGIGNETEPRFSCNVNIQTLEEAYKVVNDLCSAFRAMPYWGSGGLALAQDRPHDPAFVFTNAKVESGRFLYASSSIKQRHTVVSVGFLDLDNQEQGYEVVEDTAAIARYGIIRADVTAYACTSRSQARRVGLAILATEQTETETVTFAGALDAGIEVRPGMVIGVADRLKIGARIGGRIMASNANSITTEKVLDYLPSVGSPAITVTLPSGGVETVAVSALSGSSIYAAFSEPPLVGGAWIFGSQVSYWRVATVREVDRSRYEITAVFYNSQKYADIDRYRPIGVDGIPTFRGVRLIGTAATIAVTGNEQALYKTEAIVLPAITAELAVTGQDAALVTPEAITLQGGTGSVTVAGVSANLIDPAIRFSVTAGTLTVVGQGATLIDPSISLTAVSATLGVAGRNAALIGV
jgi:predicted phage tail protein